MGKAAAHDGPLRAVTFDFWGTLYVSGGPAEEARERRRIGLLRSVLRECRARGDAEPAPPTDERLAGLLRRSRDAFTKGAYCAPALVERLAWVLDELGVEVGQQRLEEIAGEVSRLGAEIPPAPEVSARNVVGAVAERFPVGLVSDTGLTEGRFLEEVMRAHGLVPPIAALGFSDETGWVKPAPEAFLPVLEELGVRPAEAVHVGDLLATDVAGAVGLGMRVVWIDRGAAVDGDTRATSGDLPAGVVRVERLSEVPAAVLAMEGGASARS